jgi:murein DD-endopeptidase MepM/ murein hydrolase activator NlpD
VNAARVLLVLLVAATALAGLAAFAPARAPAPALSDDEEFPMSSAEVDDAEDEGRLFTLRGEEIDGGTRYRVRNLLAGPLLVRADWTERENMLADPVLPLRRVVPALAEIELVSMRHDDRARPARFRLEYSAVPGSPNARHSLAARYRVPFAAGVDWRVGQGFHGRYSHQHPVSRYAVDFTVPVGTPVLAARAGVVMQVQDDWRGRGRVLEDFAHRANFVRLLHDDGTMAMYAHLEYYGVGVKPGQRVAAGDLLGLSGNTGYSTGPHLHFAVLVNDGRGEVSIPFDMDGVEEDVPGD